MGKICRCKSCSKHIERWILASLCMGIFFLIISMFVPRWRVDAIATQPLELLYIFSGFETRQYGLLQVKGTYSQSWNALTGTVCRFQTVSMAAGAGVTATNAVIEGGTWLYHTADDLLDLYTGISPDNTTAAEEAVRIRVGCGGNRLCSYFFTQHLWNRCTHYTKILKISIATLAMTFLAVVSVLAGIMICALTASKKTGGMSLLFFIGASIFSLVINLVWAFMTDAAFKGLAQDAWFPYPSLAISYYLHLYGSLIISASSGAFAYVVLPKTFAYDPQQEKIDRRNKRLKKLATKRQCGQMPAQQMPPVCAMNFPAPPGFSAPACQWGGAGAPPQFAQLSAPTSAVGPMARCSAPMPLGFGGSPMPACGGSPAPQSYGHPGSTGMQPQEDFGVGGPTMPANGRFTALQAHRPPQPDFGRLTMPATGGFRASQAHRPPQSDFGVGGPTMPANGGFTAPQSHNPPQSDFGVGGPTMPADGGFIAPQPHNAPQPAFGVGGPTMTANGGFTAPQPHNPPQQDFGVGTTGHYFQAGSRRAAFHS